MPAFENTRAFARAQDAADPLRAFRDEFHFPQHDGKDVLYFTGNSLGLQPKATAAALKQELDDWARFGVDGHFRAKRPWFSCHEELSPMLARLVGARPEEVVAMNSLTANLHFLMVSFYRPSFDSAQDGPKRRKILTEARPFPSDTYAIASQIAFHGGDPDTDLIEVQPRAGEHTLRTEDIVAKVHELGGELALVCLGGVNFYTGQAFDMETITKAAHHVGAIAGFDLAHAAGNLCLELHDWNVDFACWCTYKYLNSGPGGVAGAFVHQRHLGPKPAQGLPTKEGTLRDMGTSTAGSLSGDPVEVYPGHGLPLFAGWWGHDKGERFKMERTFKPMPTAEAWQVSNAPVLSMAAHRTALEQFDRAGIANLRAKSERLTAYLAFVVADVARTTGTRLEVITPDDPAQRGAQLSLIAHGHGKALFNRIQERGVMADWREPNVMRIAPVPMYNSFEDVWGFGEVLTECLQDHG